MQIENGGGVFASLKRLWWSAVGGFRIGNAGVLASFDVFTVLCTAAGRKLLGTIENSFWVALEM